MSVVKKTIPKHWKFVQQFLLQCAWLHPILMTPFLLAIEGIKTVLWMIMDLNKYNIQILTWHIAKILGRHRTTTQKYMVSWFSLYINKKAKSTFSRSLLCLNHKIVWALTITNWHTILLKTCFQHIMCTCSTKKHNLLFTNGLMNLWCKA